MQSRALLRESNPREIALSLERTRRFSRNLLSTIQPNTVHALMDLSVRTRLVKSVVLPLKLILSRLQKIYSSEVYEDYESMCHLHFALSCSLFFDRFVLSDQPRPPSYGSQGDPPNTDWPKWAPTLGLSPRQVA